MNELPKHGIGLHKVEYKTNADGTIDIIKVEFERTEKEKHSYGFGVSGTGKMPAIVVEGETT